VNQLAPNNVKSLGEPMVLFLMKVAKKKDPIFVHFATDGE
jgi:hypothetical protein